MKTRLSWLQSCVTQKNVKQITEHKLNNRKLVQTEFFANNLSFQAHSSQIPQSWLHPWCESSTYRFFARRIYTPEFEMQQ